MFSVVILCLTALPAVAASRMEDVPLCVFATGELNGVLAPCGCAPDQLGGLPRRATYLARHEGCTNRLLLDNGNLTAGFGPVEAMKVDTILLALADMGYFAVNLGEQDFYLGLDAVKHLKDVTPAVHLLSANVRHESGEELAEPFAIWRGEGAPTVLVIGVLSQMYGPQLAALRSGFVLDDPAVAMRRILAEQAGNVNLVVVLLRGPVAEARELAKRFPQIGLLVAASDESEGTVERATGGPQLILVPGSDGEHVVSADLAPAAGGGWAATPREVTPLTKNLADSPEIEKLLKAYQQRLFDERLLDKIKRRPLGGGLKYVGNRACQPCHQMEYDLWSKLRHADAYKTLVEDGHQYDPDCVYCHVTGFGYDSGFRGEQDTPELASVGCEACHHPGSRHVEAQAVSLEEEEPYGAVAPADCLACHTQARSPNFDYATDLPKIDHWTKQEETTNGANGHQ